MYLRRLSVLRPYMLNITQNEDRKTAGILPKRLKWHPAEWIGLSLGGQDTRSDDDEKLPGNDLERPRPQVPPELKLSPPPTTQVVKFIRDRHIPLLRSA